MSTLLSLSDLGHEYAQAPDDRPWLDPDGLLRWGDRWVAVSPNEESVLRPLLARWGHVVPRASLAGAVWADPSSSDRALSALMVRLRRRLRPLGIDIATLKARGYLLASSRDRAAQPREPVYVGLADVLSEGPSWLIS